MSQPTSTTQTDPDNYPAPVQQLLVEAMQMRASDVHIDRVGPDECRVCCRVDGVVHRKETLSADDGRQLINQIKVAAALTPEQARQTRENRIPVTAAGETREIRVTVAPTTRGEAVHLRLLAPPQEILEPAQLGMSDGALDAVRETFAQPEGLILVTGPTGAGKTMTLYSLASFLDMESMIAISVEDPVEYDLPNIRQIQADPEHGMAIPAALKAMLRMDPDILLVGEIRDAQSAQTAVRAAASGRFVLATLHAREIGLALETCHHYSVPRHLLGSTLRLVTSQALVRRVCGECAGKREPTDAEAEQFQDRDLDVPDHLPVPKGCGACHDFGYSGRVGVFEVVQIDRETGRRLSQRRVAENMREALDRAKKTSLPREALQKVAAGVTTMEEICHLYVPGHLGAGEDEPFTGTTPRDTV